MCGAKGLGSAKHTAALGKGIPVVGEELLRAEVPRPYTWTYLDPDPVNPQLRTSRIRVVVAGPPGWLERFFLHTPLVGISSLGGWWADVFPRAEGWRHSMASGAQP